MFQRQLLASPQIPSYSQLTQILLSSKTQGNREGEENILDNPLSSPSFNLNFTRLFSTLAFTSICLDASCHRATSLASKSNYSNPCISNGKEITNPSICRAYGCCWTETNSNQPGKL